MITHVVLFGPAGALAESEERALVGALDAAVRACPSVRGCRVGRRVRHGLPGYESHMRVPYEYALLLDFESLEGLKAYLQHPAHAALGSAFADGQASLAYDYDMAPLDSAADLFPSR